MVPSGAAETIERIAHFAGYLRLQPDGIITTQVDYDGVYAPRQAVSDDLDLSAGTTDRTSPPDNDLNGLQSPPTTLVASDEYDWSFGYMPNFSGALDDVRDDFARLKFPLPTQAPQTGVGGAGGGGGGGGEYKWFISQPGGESELADSRQINSLSDDDNATAGPYGLQLVGPFEMHLASADASATFAGMLAKANDSVPAGLLPDFGNDHSAPLIDFVAQDDSDPAQNQADDAPYAAIPGLYVDGVLVQDSAIDIHQAANDALTAAATRVSDALAGPREALTGDNSETHIQTLSLGDNIAVNDAVIVSYGELCGSLLVLGDFYRTSVICQTNVFTQNDHFANTNAGNTNYVTIMPNAVHNAAEFSSDGAVDGPWVPGGPLGWSVDVFDGSLYDVKSLVQTNWISDNDVVSQTQSVGYSEVLVGSNDQGNIGYFANLSAKYDVIMVLGSYHQANMIHQVNVVLNANDVWQSSTGEAGPADGSVLAGNNALLNDGTITYWGSDGSLPVTPEMADLANALADGSEPGMSSILSAFPDLFGSVHALVVTGDCWDINYICQVNAISDVNVAAQLMTAAGGTQSATTGSDQAINAATIIDGGSLTTPFIQGGVYTDSILIQCNIISPDQKVIVNDPSQLATELVAFTGTDASTPADDVPQLFTPADSQHQNDILTSGFH
jgi:hypothetical protein